MVELSIRLLVSGLLVFATGIVAPGEFVAALGVAGIQASGAGLMERLIARGLMSGRVALAFAAIDAGAIAVVLARGVPPMWAAALAPLALVGPALAIRLRDASPNLALPLAPLAVAGAFAANGDPNLAILPTVATTLAALAMWANGGVRTVTLTVDAPVVTKSAEDEDAVLADLRLAFRKLREAYRELEKSSRRDRMLAGLGEARMGMEGTQFERVTSRLRKLAGADGLVLYTVAQYDDLFVVRAAVGDLAAAQTTQPLEINAKAAAADIAHGADHLLATLRDGVPGTNVPLLHDGRVVGVLAASAKDADEVPRIAAALEGVAPWVAGLVVDGTKRESTERRLRETELLYAVSTGTDGASGRSDLAQRAVRELKEILEADHISIALVENGVLTPLASEGVKAPILEAMSFAGGAGVEGWVRTGAPEIAMSDVRNDGRCSPESALRARIGSFVAIPLGIANGIGAVLCAATARVGGLDLPQIEALRAAGAELARRFAKPLTSDEGEGLLAPSEFATRLMRGGALVTLDPIRLEVHEAAFGKPATTHALRTLAQRVRARLPEGAAACRTGEGRVLVWLPSATEAEAVSWGNEMAAISGTLGLRTPDGTRRIPIALRAKAAVLEPQTRTEPVSERLPAA